MNGLGEKYAHRCNIGMNGMGLDKPFLLGFKVNKTELMSGTVNSAQNL